MSQLHIEDALDFLVRHLAQKFPPAGGVVETGIGCAVNYDVQITSVAAAYWSSRRVGIVNLGTREAEKYYRPFFDAAWHLCRIGVLRPSETAPIMGIHGPGIAGDGYSLTAAGRKWLASASSRPPADPSRLLQIMQPFGARFGPGFLQRASEASGCYLAANYLACCAMSGAAAESILLAVATTKAGDEAKVLAEYRTSSGRSKVIRQVLANVTAGLSEQFRVASGVLSFWRDEAAHGTHSTVSEVEASASLAQLLRFAQLVADNWPVLTLQQP